MKYFYSIFKYWKVKSHLFKTILILYVFNCTLVFAEVNLTRVEKQWLKDNLVIKYTETFDELHYKIRGYYIVLESTADKGSTFWIEFPLFSEKVNNVSY